MLNNLGAKAIVPVAVTVTGFALVCCILLYAGIKADMTRDAVAHSLTLADTVVKSTRFAMLRADRETLGNIVDSVGRQQEVDHLRIFDKKGLISFSSNRVETGRFVDKDAGGCLGCHNTPTPRATLEQMQQARRIVGTRGGDILAVTAPIYNEPSCSNASCHVHPEGQKILGILDIGFDLAPLQASLASLRWRMAIFTLMLLILTGIGVAALLRRSVITPIQRLIDFTGREINDSLNDEGHGLHDEIGTVADNHHRLRRRLHAALAELAVLSAKSGVIKD
ncbi:MAG: HAMP domain-containing protein [Desulfuromonadales bacterium GWD2_61_12]|nr:MAG: HAMP domain-containing protein [Desulfuromonadales bacterium GWC2_61_20]OGR35611.1 MAG: HAMP domain-containing protein [Desulfuromonadales bacterium GWD2_61_12]HAD04393.1 HAMP domain-containing protein [Desulfuromonas sp.]HBT84190.1 HAMP domain-containing protein [Desulfuromonas sp.]